MKRNWNLYGIAALLAVFFLAVGVIALPVTQVGAQTKTEVCDNQVDDDDDKLIDCEDPDCAEDPACKTPPDGEGCSPGYWKNHLDHFNAVCGSVSGWTCDTLYTAITCRGSNASCAN